MAIDRNIQAMKINNIIEGRENASKLRYMEKN